LPDHLNGRAFNPGFKQYMPNFAQDDFPERLDRRALLRIFPLKQHVPGRCQVPQVDIAELSHFLSVIQAMYSLYRFFAHNGDGVTNL
jgi:hypothetical protein